MKINTEIKLDKVELQKAVQNYLNIALGSGIKVSVTQMETSPDASIWLVVKADLEKVTQSYQGRD